MHSYSEKDSPFFVDPSVCSSSDNEAVSTAVLRAASDEADWLWGLVVREEVAIDPMATNLVWEKVGGGVTEDKTLWMFDVDGTLCSSNTSDTLHLTAVLWLEKHKPQKVALCTNQGGVGLRYWMEPRTNEGYDGFGHDRWPSLPTEDAVYGRLLDLADQVKAVTGGEVKVYFSFLYLSQKGNWSPVPAGQEANPVWSREWRKPNPGMLLRAIADYGVAPEDCAFVGDQESDQQAAEAAGVAFFDADKFFSVPVTIYYPTGWVADWLPPFRRIGLDLTATKRRLEDMLRREIAAYWRVGEVVCQKMDYGEDEFELSPEAAGVVAGDALASCISNLFINREWLVYESAEEHADALRGTRWLWANSLVDIYGIDAKEAWRLCHE